VEELDLVEGLRNRQETAVAEFLDRYRSLFFHCIGHFESDPSAREDLYQDLVMYVLERLDGDRFNADKGSFGTWLYRVAWCRCVDLKRRESTRRRPRFAAVTEEVLEQQDTHPGPAQVAGEGELGGIVREAVSELDDEEQKLIELRFVEGNTLGQISGSLAISLEQTKYRLRRATISLRRVLLNQFAVEEVTD
jgi:RNA polymerase sigma factor (sigma-70 family)